MDKKPNKSIWKKWWFWVLLFFGLPFISLVILASIGNSLPQEASKVPSVTSQAVATQPVVTQAPKYVFDVPSFVGKNIEEIRSILGEPSDGKLKDPNAEQLKLGTKQWDNTFKKDGKELLVTYNVSTRKVVDFFISTDDKTGATKDKNHLLELGNIKQNDPNYKVDFVKALNDSSVFTGVKVIPL